MEQSFDTSNLHDEIMESKGNTTKWVLIIAAIVIGAACICWSTYRKKDQKDKS